MWTLTRLLPEEAERLAVRLRLSPLLARRPEPSSLVEAHRWHDSATLPRSAVGVLPHPAVSQNSITHARQAIVREP